MSTPEFYSRKTELDFLAQIFLHDGPDIIGVHGVAGVGKSSLLRQFLKQSPELTLLLNCQLIKPASEAFIHHLAQAAEDIGVSLNHIANNEAGRLIILLDHFESIQILESWLRLDFIPLFKKRIKLVFASRVAPDDQWVINPPDLYRYRSLKLTGLSDIESVAYLLQAGHSESNAIKINVFTNGHPLALRLTSNAILEQPTHDIADIALSHAQQTLINYFLNDIENVLLKQATEAIACADHVNETILAEMLNLNDASDLYQQLSSLEFVEHYQDGLRLSNPLKQALVSSLKMRSPQLLNQYRKSADIMRCAELPLPIWFDKSARQILIEGKRIDLTPLEYNTLTLLITHQGNAVTRKELLEKVWRVHYDSASNVVDTLILALRKKLADKAIHVQSVRGIGYRFVNKIN